MPYASDNTVSRYKVVTLIAVRSHASQPNSRSNCKLLGISECRWQDDSKVGMKVMLPVFLFFDVMPSGVSCLTHCTAVVTLNRRFSGSSRPLNFHIAPFGTSYLACLSLFQLLANISFKNVIVSLP